MACVIVAEASLFAVFVVAYLYDLGKSLGGPSPGEVLSVRSSAPSACSRAA